MAYRDRSQGFGFVYLDLASLIANKDELERKHFPTEIQKNAQTIQFNREVDMKPRNEGNRNVNSPSEGIAQIRENLDRLQALHHKLHAMLEELNQISGQSKKNKGDGNGEK